MKKHIYLHFSNFDHLRDLRDDESFEGADEYDTKDTSRLFRHEYGRLVTYKNYYHILLGRLDQEGCPWCVSPVQVVKLSIPKELGYTAYCIQCMECGSRGPSLNIPVNTQENKEMVNEFMDLLWKRYKNRRAWDEGFVNPYESYNSSPKDEK